MRTPIAPTEEAFWDATEAEPMSGCLLWAAGSQLVDGYGRVSWNGRMQQVHRIAWQLANGPIPEGMFVCHRCDVRCCVKPAHLFLGTNADNLHDMKAKGRARAPRGQASHRAVLTEAQVHEIRSKLGAGETQASIARDYGVTYSAIRNIKVGWSWAWLAEPAQDTGQSQHSL